MSSRFFLHLIASSALILLSSPALASAGGMPDLAQMFANFGGVSVNIMNMLVGLGFLFGIFLAGLGLFKFKQYAENSGQVKLSTPIFITVIAAALIAMPGSINVATNTLSLGNNSGTALMSQLVDSPSLPGMAAAMTGILLFIKLIGHIAFFRGLLIYKGLAEGKQGETFGRGTTHVLGGAAAINIQMTILVLVATFAPGMTLPLGLGGG